MINIKDRIIFLIFSCKKNLDSRISLMKESWIKELEEIGYTYFIVYGNPKMDKPYIINGNEFIVKAKDDYQHFPKKVIRTFFFIKKEFGNQIDGVFKFDDDIIVNLVRLKNYLPEIKKHNYFGRISNYENQYNNTYKGLINQVDYQGPYYNGNSGYYISTKGIDFLEKQYNLKLPKIINELFEDKLVGDAMREMGEEIKENPCWTFTCLRYIISNKSNPEFRERFKKIKKIKTINQIKSIYRSFMVIQDGIVLLEKIKNNNLIDI